MADQLPAKSEPKPLRQQIEALKPELAKVLPKHIDADAFVRNVHTAMQLQPELEACNPRSLFASCLKAANDGLILDGREAALVVRNVNVAPKGQPKKWEKHATYLPMVQGLMKLARNSGDVASLIAHVVYEHDTFTYVLGDEERIEHAPAPFGVDRGKPIGVYAIAKLRDGTVIREVMRAEQVLAIASQGSNAWQYQPPTETVDERGEKTTRGGVNYAEWWRKTAIRRIVKYMPRSSDAVGRFVDAAEVIDDDFDFEPEPKPRPEPIKKRGAAAAALNPKPAAPPVEEIDNGPVIDHDEDGVIADDATPTDEDMI